MRFLVLFPLFCSYLLASEPSAFGAGDLNNPNPYGLTHEEKLIQENKKEIEGIAHKNNLQTAKVESVSERLDGMQGIIEGLSQSVNEQKIAISNLSTVVSDNNQSALLDALSKQNSTNEANIVQLKTVLEELSSTVDAINTSYVSKEEFSALMKELKVSVSSAPKKLDNPAMEKEAKNLFDQKKYDEAQSYYEMMVQKKYKVSDATFWIGECYFERKKYKDAIGYYKQSAAQNEKALYMPTLLLHTGMSMEANGDIASAKAFYNATVSKFSGSGAATTAKEKLAKLK
ncbi:MAG: tetratricopeptide repeat protein [Sulfuricurvum sp.]|uniref:tetratricopeptide repeat protein n=1 Tax=Sulfuricurvum sp. TaxID=2025608 RepID=UPI0026254ABB|nr:tetratricopeptide repeat protein [Sulfuricurvum sp.]MDD2829306.1 tetratricopeptide repeat protein [Sulfuricurvum sp.]MDD4948623.1 tetratricopeptide repeat protein [Sulfuricurvum sp.]